MCLNNLIKNNYKVIKMGSAGDNWATAYRNTRAWYTAIGLFGLLVWTFYNNATMPSVTHLDNVDAVIVDISPPMNGKKKPEYATLKLEMANSQIIKIISNTQQNPKVGDIVPISIENYDDATKLYSIKYQQWKERKSGL